VKKICYLLILLSFGANAQTNNQINLPAFVSFQEMAPKFFQTYSLPETKEYNQYVFAKKPNGWHILLIEYKNHKKELEDQLFWDRSTQTYLKLNFPALLSDEGNQIPKDYNTWDNQYFNAILPYYGYVGWDVDIIKDYGAKQNLSDSVLNALARAYASCAANLLGNNTGFGNPDSQFQIKCTLNSLSKEQLDTYRKYEHLCIETYKRLWKLNPRFENFVGDIYTVYSNEIMNSFLTLRYYQNEEEAHKELTPNLYDPFYIATAKNYLASCDSNAVIFTNGDSDTFPLLYVQEEEGFRKDVLVINISLLQLPQYINHLFDRIGLSEPISTYIDKELYKNGSLQYAYIINKLNKDQPAEIKNLMTFINSTDSTTKFKNGSDYLTYIPTNHLQLTVNKKNTITHHIVEPDDSIKIEAKMNWTLKNDQAIYQNEIAMLDIISCANFKRPIYFAITVSEENCLNLEKYFQLDGLAYKIVPIKCDTYQNYDYGRINTSSLFNKFKNVFFYANLDNDSVYLSTNHKRMISTFRNQYARLATALIDEAKPDSAKEIVALCFKRFPSTKNPLDYFAIPLIKCYFKLNEFELANSLATDLVNTYSTDLEACQNHNLSLTNDDKMKIKIALYILNELNSLSINFNQDDLGKVIKSKIEKYQNSFDL